MREKLLLNSKNNQVATMASFSSTTVAEVTKPVDEKPGTMVRKVLAMAGGDGEESYVKNSFHQQRLNDTAYSVLNPSIQRLVLPAANGGPFVISDLGCSSGPNTIKIVSDVVKMLKKAYQVQGQDEPEFQAYFNDLPSTDFNVLFQLLDSELREFYYSGVPGSFYGRLFPRSSVNVFLSTNTLHWISQIPPAVTDKNSAAYNKDRVWVHGTNTEVIKAYKQQCTDDMKNFLDARGEELNPGGLLFCIFGSASERAGDCDEKWLRPISEDKPDTKISVIRIFETVWDALISEGILTEEQRAVCNIPCFKFTKEELEEILKSYDDIFRIEYLEEMSSEATPLSRDTLKIRMRHFSSVLAPYFSAILGSDLTSTLFDRLTERVIERVNTNGILSEYICFVMALVRK